MAKGKSAKGKSKKYAAAFPTKQEIIEYMKDAEARVSKRELVRAFNIQDSDRLRFNQLFSEILEEGKNPKPTGAPNKLGDSADLHITAKDEDGNFTAVPAKWDRNVPVPKIYVTLGDPNQPDLAIGDRVRADLRENADGSYQAKVVRRAQSQSITLTGVYVKAASETQDGVVQPTAKGQKHKKFYVRPEDVGNAQVGDIVKIVTHPSSKRARITESVGDLSNPKAPSIIAIETHGLPTEFLDQSIAEAAAAKVPDLGTREDLRNIPLVTIDGEDARDFDDAVFAEKTEQGWHIIVAIADVAHYVREGSALNKDAYERGTSVYFPDRVVPMLPEELSNGLCSLKPHEDRACMAMHMWIDDKGKLVKQKVTRALMNSAARLTYTQVQKAYEGNTDDTTAPLMSDVISPLYEAHKALFHARLARGAMDLDIQEQIVVLDKLTGFVQDIVAPERIRSQRVIEDFMIAANVASARLLRGKHGMYRIHEAPSQDRMEELSGELAELGYSLHTGKAVHPHVFTRILDLAKQNGDSEVVSNLLLGAQSKAVYSPDNVGHFGLALPEYTHFTSPIRRYPDLVAHRAIISAYGLGKDGLSLKDAARLEEMGLHTSKTERRAQAASYDARDRYISTFFSSKIGQVFEARIRSVKSFGVFVTLNHHGGGGLAPIGLMQNDKYKFNPKTHSFKGAQTRTELRVGDTIKVQLKTADPVSGNCAFAMLEKIDAQQKPIIQGQKLRMS